ncbi:MULTISPECIES: CdaR family transcriptional regulator [unclassified Streptomyces]|uniref:PucR family transcriptional regulator n=1 Tax=unclassified Streptomyces TaxID=2593676 RepID=UPI000884A1EC|nr:MULTISPECIES: PucR family transcriptional regulator [unclassified Streptomyces]PBC86486.1 CdaR family transcriptional regulator [Streptomyces sp. 2321.6]SDQ82590.1 transcriptional regulator, CdaR family [Streptomyces sp. KS_16]SEE00066.1 transcriptional regulator, CdaR family [Streptomyces sp. 2133.1]SNC73459.1 PucR C-terminal helix-turn-helix domain-containing protein [Streptomyces sp. 2114.4]
MKERERIRQRLIADPGVVAAVVTAVREQVPAYAALDDGRLHEVRAIAAWALDRLLHLWVTDGALTPADLRRFRGIAAARAADGRPMQAVLRAYRVAATVLTDEIAAATPPPAAPDAFALARMALTTLDTLSEEMATAYTATSEDLTADRDRALRLLLDDLISGRHASIGALTDRAARLGRQLPDPYCLLVAEPADADGAGVTQETAAGLLSSFGGHDGGLTPLVTVRGSRAVLLLPAAAGASAPRVLGERGLRGCALSGESLDRIAVAYRLAADALDTAPAHAHHSERVLTDGDAQVLALLGGRPATTPEQISRLILGPLLQPGRRHLMDALTTYLDTGSANAAARKLGLHPQSLRYRLRRIADLTTRDPRDPWQRLTLDIARTIAH